MGVLKNKIKTFKLLPRTSVSLQEVAPVVFQTTAIVPNRSIMTSLDNALEKVVEIGMR
jgi:hypothetical protein